MARRRPPLGLLLALLAACQLATEGGLPGPGSGTTVVPTATSVGLPQGSPVAATIGAAGGTLSDPGGAVRLTVPAGAVAAPTEFTVTPISSRAPGAVGTSWRIEAAQPFTGQVEVTFKGLGSYRPGLSLGSLSIRWQDARGFWLAPEGVTRDAGGDTITATTSHLSDWALVLAGTPALEGTFTVTQTAITARSFATLPFSAIGTAALYELTGMGEPTYLLTGTATLPPTIVDGTRTCTPDAQTQNLVLSVAEIPDAVFRWGINALWGLTCVEDGTGALSTVELATLFDTMFINLPCGGEYVGTQVNGPGFIQGSYTSDCGADGTVSATWDFRACTAGGACVPANECETGTVTCSLGIGSCTPDGGFQPPATPCDASGSPGECDGAGGCVPL